MLVVISTSAVPVGLRGELTRWLLEISPGTFVGNISARSTGRTLDDVYRASR